MELQEKLLSSGPHLELLAQKHLCLCVHSSGLGAPSLRLAPVDPATCPGDQHVGAASQMRNREITKPPATCDEHFFSTKFSAPPLASPWVLRISPKDGRRWEGSTLIPLAWQLPFQQFSCFKGPSELSERREGWRTHDCKGWRLSPLCLLSLGELPPEDEPRKPRVGLPGRTPGWSCPSGSPCWNFVGAVWDLGGPVQRIHVIHLFLQVCPHSTDTCYTS